MVSTKKLYMETVVNDGSTKTYTIAFPSSRLALEDVKAAMDVAIAKDFFLVNGVKPVSLKSAYMQEIIRTDLD